MNKLQNRFRPSICNAKLLDNESPVQSGLSYTPADMRTMTQKGYPVSPQTLSDDYFSDTDNRPGNNFDVDVWEKRGVSINDVWESQQDSRQKIKDAHRNGAFENVNVEQSNI